MSQNTFDDFVITSISIRPLATLAFHLSEIAESKTNLDHLLSLSPEVRDATEDFLKKGSNVVVTGLKLQRALIDYCLNKLTTDPKTTTSMILFGIGWSIQLDGTK